MKCVVIEFKKTKKFRKELGKNCIVYHFYFFRVWILYESLLEMLKKSHDKGVSEGRQILRN